MLCCALLCCAVLAPSPGWAKTDSSGLGVHFYLLESSVSAKRLCKKNKKTKKRTEQTNKCSSHLCLSCFICACVLMGDSVYCMCVCACTLPFFGVSTHVLYPSVNMHVCVCTCVLAACNINMLGTAGLQKLGFD